MTSNLSVRETSANWSTAALRTIDRTWSMSLSGNACRLAVLSRRYSGVSSSPRKNGPVMSFIFAA